MNKTLTPYPVPTSTVIAHVKDKPHWVYVIEQAVKHNGRDTLIGGRCTLPGQSHSACIRDEWAQEAGGKGAMLRKVRHWAYKTDRYADPRVTTLGKVTDKQCPEELINQPVLGLYGSPDAIFIAEVNGTPYPSDGEAKRCFLVDVHDIKITATAEESNFGAQHDLVLALYALTLKNPRMSTRNIANALEDMSSLRAYLIRMQNE